MSQPETGWSDPLLKTYIKFRPDDQTVGFSEISPCDELEQFKHRIIHFQSGKIKSLGYRWRNIESDNYDSCQWPSWLKQLVTVFGKVVALKKDGQVGVMRGQTFVPLVEFGSQRFSQIVDAKIPPQPIDQ